MPIFSQYNSITEPQRPYSVNAIPIIGLSTEHIAHQKNYTSDQSAEMIQHIVSGHTQGHYIIHILSSNK